MKKINESIDNVFFTSDMHFGHSNIITFANRPYRDIEDMDNSLINNWNNIVPENGLIFVLGDIGFTDNNRIIDIFNQLNGRKILIKGNHDSNYKSEILNSIFEEIYDSLYIRLFDDNLSKYYYLVLCHYPMLDWQSSFRGSWQLFGHLHTRSLPEFDTFKTRLFAKQYDVGVDNNDFKPISFSNLQQIIADQEKDKTFKTTNYY